MLINKQAVFEKEEQIDDGQKIERLLLRILPYWPLIVLAIATGWIGAHIYLRYQVPLYSVNAKLLINDETQQQSTNLNEVVNFEYKDVSEETEREIQVLTSRDLISNLISRLQLNVIYTQQGLVRTIQQYTNRPVTLELENPDSIKSTSHGEVEIINNKIRFGGKMYPVDTWVSSEFGNIRWRINNDFVKNGNGERGTWLITVMPVNAYVGSVRGSLTIEPISERSSTLKLTYFDVSPDRGVVILDTLIELYGKFTLDYKKRISQNTLRFLDQRLALIAEELSGVERNLENFKSSQGITDLGIEGGISLGRFKETDVKLGELDVQLDVIKQIEQYVSRRNNSSSAIPATLGLTDPILSGLLNQLYQAEAELEKVKQVSGIKNPQVEVYESQIAKLKPSIVSSINNLKISLLSGKRGLQAENNRVMASLSNIPRKERLLLDISRQQGIKNAIYTFLLQKREESALAASSILPDSRIIEKPQHGGQIYPVPIRNYTAGILGALFLVAVFIFFKEFAGRKVLYRSQIEDTLSLPVIAEIIFQPNQKTSPIVVSEGKRTMIAEQFRELRTNLNFITSNTKDNCKVILITSSVPKEGKSFVAINTAITLTLTGAKVVIIEADLRNPKISRPLGMHSDIGMSNYLIGKATETDIILPHPSIRNLNIISAGALPPNPAELLSTPRLSDLISYLKQHYDFVVIDSPPVAAVTDSKILGTVADATLYIIRYKYTNQTLLKLIKENHLKNSLPNIYLVFNGIINKKFFGYAYGRGYGYGYGYTAEDKEEPFFKKLLKKKKV
jgi:capsular exopolysaccharide synthesis family protein